MANTNQQTDFIAYHYQPSLVAAIVLTGVFSASAALHLYQIIRTRTFTLVPLIIGILFEVVGYAARAISASETYPHFSLAPYIIQALLILVAPALLAASIYMMLGYIILAVDGEQHSLIKKQFLTKIFVLGDICSFMVQSTGAGLLTKKQKNAPVAGKWIIIGGLAIQLMFFGYFMVVGAVFHVRLTKSPTQRSQDGRVPWRVHMWVLFVASMLIFVRSVFRVVEYVQGDNGYILSHEMYLYIFDAALMGLVVVLFNVVHPSQITGLLTGGGVARKLVKVEHDTKLADPKEGNSSGFGEEVQMHQSNGAYRLDPVQADYALA